MTKAQRIDTELAQLYAWEQRQVSRLGMFISQAQHEAGAKFYYRGRKRVTDMTIAEAEAILAADMAAHPDNGDDFGYTLVRGGTSIGNIRRTVEGIAEARAQIKEARAAMATLEEQYTGWSRFFLVTSSKGHIHKSLNCSTCRITTTFGWLPDMSGRSEADCVSEFGPALCSVCFPSAPVEWTTAEITKAAAAKAAA